MLQLTIDEVNAIGNVNPYSISDTPPDDNGCKEAKAALEALSMVYMDRTLMPLPTESLCKRCPFPFCVHAEARSAQDMVKARLLLIMNQLNVKLEQRLKWVANELGVSIRSAQRYTHKRNGCIWCSLASMSTAPVYYTTNVYTMVQYGCAPTIVLNAHRRANSVELNSMQTQVEYVFPACGLEYCGSECTHEFWVVRGVDEQEANNVYKRMRLLRQFAPIAIDN